MLSKVVGNPVDQFMTETTKVFFAHVAQIRRHRRGVWGFSRRHLTGSEGTDLHEIAS